MQDPRRAPRRRGQTRVGAGALALAAGLGAGGLVGCFQDDFLLGAYCVRDGDCGGDQCCAGFRCRPRPDHCERGVMSETPYRWAYMRCETDDDCLVHGIPRCVWWRDAAVGFCSDYCVGDALNCESRVVGDARACLELEGQRLCALDCAEDGRCPSGMDCDAGVCVPRPEEL